MVVDRRRPQTFPPPPSTAIKHKKACAVLRVHTGSVVLLSTTNSDHSLSIPPRYPNVVLARVDNSVRGVE